MKENIKILIKSFKHSLSITCSVGKALTGFYIVLQIINSTLPLFITFVFSGFLDALAYNKSEKEITLYLAFFFSAAVLSLFTGNLSRYVASTLADKTGREYDRRILRKLNELPLSVIDTSKGRDLIDNVQNFKGLATSVFSDALGIFSSIYSFIIAFAAIFVYNPLFAIIFVVLTIPGIIVDSYFYKKNTDLAMNGVMDTRKFNYYKWMLVDLWPGRDVRMYDLTEPILKRHVEEMDKYINKRKKLADAGLRSGLGSEFIKRSGEVVFTVFVIVQAFQGVITIGEVALYIGFALGICESFAAAARAVADMFIVTAPHMSWLFEFFDIPGVNITDKSSDVKSFESIEFKDVYFKYPLQENYVLKGVSFKLNKGERMSIVGINGAGKSTIIKLILGLYEIESGEILLNGHPIGEYNTKDLHALFSVMFQQYVQYPLSLRENVALSAVESLNDDERILAALKQSSAPEFLFSNIDVNMTRQFDDKGVELSKGQWQSVALSRVFFKDAPVLIFDEPAVSLDAEAEDYILDNYMKLSSQKTGIMISHRIYGAKFSTKIIVLQDGKITECGTHDELVEKNGFYCELYNLQKSKYMNGEETTA